ncbi:hypothetical protein K469DRAFT_508013, partial [Zopfia rhizophila CBS 207.26]
LLRLPLELQLSIYELVIIQDGPLLLNCPCNSSYRGRYKQMQQDEEAWVMGEEHPPLQPALSRTCRLTRRVTLPIFYKENIFRASYCYQGGILPIKWLHMIGKENREMLRHLYFYDRNQDHDQNNPRDLKAVKACEIFTEMGGRLETFSNQHGCAHLVTFGNYKRREGETPIAVQ